MNLTVLLIAAYLPLPLILFMILRSGSFGKGSVGTLLKLFFLGVLAAVPAFLMEAGGLLALEVLLRVIPESAFGGSRLLVSTILRYVLAVALIEEAWKHFVLRVSTWKQMVMETVGDGIAASAVVGAGFSAVLYGAWQAAWRLVPADMGALHGAMPDYLRAGAVISFLYAVGFLISHFGYSGLMGMFYGVAKRSEQKAHGGRAGFMLFISCLIPVLVHGLFAALIGYGIASEKVWWFAVGFAAQVVVALLMASVLSHSADDAFAARQLEREQGEDPDRPVDFADSEEFAAFAESEGGSDVPGLEGGTGRETAGGLLSAGHGGPDHRGRDSGRNLFSMPLVGPDARENDGHGYAGAGSDGFGSAGDESDYTGTGADGNGFGDAGQGPEDGDFFAEAGEIPDR